MLFNFEKLVSLAYLRGRASRCCALRRGRGFTRGLRFFIAGCILLLLAGCMSLPKTDLREAKNAPLDWSKRQQQLLALRNWTLTGALAVKNQNQGGQLRFHWRQQSQRYTIDMTAPLGGVIAKVQGGPGAVSLTKPNAAPKQARSPERLFIEELGWQFPVSLIQYWVRGLPAPGSDAKTTFDQYQHLQSLTQAGWHIEFNRYTALRGIDVPAKMTLTRPPLRLRLVITSWQ